jgi:hypothetical protein
MLHGCKPVPETATFACVLAQTESRHQFSRQYACHHSVSDWLEDIAFVDISNSSSCCCYTLAITLTLPRAITLTLWPENGLQHAQLAR